MIRFPGTVLTLDLETHSFPERYAMTPREYFRLGGYSWGESDEVVVTTDYDEMLRVIREASMVIGHNEHSFDLSVLFGVDSIEPVRLTRSRRVFDTYIHATLANPAPEGYYQGRGGRRYPSTKPEEYRKWYSLDNQAFQLGVPGKLSDLAEIADRYEFEDVPILDPEGQPVRYKSGKRKGEAKTTKQRIDGVCCGYGHIPLDLPEYVDYLRQDVRACREVARALLDLHPFNHYAQREQLKAAIDAQISRNGWLVDQPLVTQRIVDMAEEAAYALESLNGTFGFPLTGKKPTASTAGKEAMLRALVSVGVREKDIARTPTGALSFSGDSVKRAAGYEEINGQLVRPEAHVEEKEVGVDGEYPVYEKVWVEPNLKALDLADLLAILAGQRSLAELTEKSVHADGRVHPSIQPLQRSGRKSTTEPGLTVFDDDHKDYYLADSPDHALVEFDYSNADARAVAAMSGDEAFAVRFQPGEDGHLINAIAAWGIELVTNDQARLRAKAKPGGHAWGYRVGPAQLALTLGIPFREAKRFLDNLNKEFPGVVAWQNEVTEFGETNEYVVNDWGRIMPITRSAYTQGPALLGQSVTNEILADGLIKLPERILRMVKVTVHDAIVLSIPRATLERDRDVVVRCLQTSWKPKTGGQEIEFPVGYGPPGANWKEAIHD